ncbi:MAG: hypothetical protein MR371_08570 [Clostridia bacterium]|nr:hypothetical protein [Clostridia bacterium]
MAAHNRRAPQTRDSTQVAPQTRAGLPNCRPQNACRLRAHDLTHSNVHRLQALCPTRLMRRWQAHDSLHSGAQRLQMHDLTRSDARRSRALFLPWPTARMGAGTRVVYSQSREFLLHTSREARRRFAQSGRSDAKHSTQLNTQPRLNIARD